MPWFAEKFSCRRPFNQEVVESGRRVIIAAGGVDLGIHSSPMGL